MSNVEEFNSFIQSTLMLCIMQTTSYVVAINIQQTKNYAHVILVILL